MIIRMEYDLRSGTMKICLRKTNSRNEEFAAKQNAVRSRKRGKKNVLSPFRSLWSRMTCMSVSRCMRVLYLSCASVYFFLHVPLSSRIRLREKFWTIGFQAKREETAKRINALKNKAKETAEKSTDPAIRAKIEEELKLAADEEVQLEPLSLIRTPFNRTI